MEPQGTVVTTNETYVLSSVSPHNLKIREDALDLKVLASVAPDGLEQWRPVLKAPFPVDALAVTAVFDALGVGVGHALRKQYDRRSFLRDLVAAEPRLLAVDVTKGRARLTSTVTAAEYVELVVGGTTWYGVAFEDEDPERLRALLSARKFDPHTNTNYPLALKRMLGWPAAVHH